MKKKTIFLSLPKSYTFTQQQELSRIVREIPGITVTLWSCVMELHAETYTAIGAAIDLLNEKGYKAEVMSGTVRG